MLFFIVFILGIASDLLIPAWWSFVPIAFVSGFFWGRGSLQSFLAGFLAVTLGWTFLILIRSVPNHHILAERAAHFFFMPHWAFLILATSLLMGIIAGFSSFSGYLLRKAVKWKNI